MRVDRKLSREDMEKGLHTKKIETHCHTLGGSGCALVPAKDVVKAYVDAGYDALMITNHYDSYSVEKPGLSPRECAQKFIDLYREAKSWGDEMGLEVWFGLEAWAQNDNLIFGAEEDFVLENPRLYEMTPEELFRECEQYGCLLYMAHPFRGYVQNRYPEFLHGVEVYNSHRSHNNQNEKAEAWALEHGLRMSAGGDYHELGMEGLAGIYVPEFIKDSRSLAAYMRDNELTLYRGE